MQSSPRKSIFITQTYANRYATTGAPSQLHVSTQEAGREPENTKNQSHSVVRRHSSQRRLRNCSGHIANVRHNLHVQFASEQLSADNDAIVATAGSQLDSQATIPPHVGPLLDLGIFKLLRRRRGCVEGHNWAITWTTSRPSNAVVVIIKDLIAVQKVCHEDSRSIQQVTIVGLDRRVALARSLPAKSHSERIQSIARCVRKLLSHSTDDPRSDVLLRVQRIEAHINTLCCKLKLIKTFYVETKTLFSTVRVSSVT